MNWQPINTAPKNWENFLACQAGSPEVGECTWDDDFNRWANPYDYEPLNWTPTHWMPLPEPPPIVSASKPRHSENTP